MVRHPFAISLRKSTLRFFFSFCLGSFTLAPELFAPARFQVTDFSFLGTEQGKRLAKPYAQAMLAMLPKTSYNMEDREHVHHEPINDVHVHGYTMQQVFLPTSESRHFTRQDAAKAFHRTMLPAEERSQHPELIAKVKGRLGGESSGESHQKFVKAAKESEEALVRRAQEAKDSEEARTMKIKSDRFEFRIQSFNSEKVGPAGRARYATGWRYGAPLDDRKRGKVRIPTSVP